MISTLLRLATLGTFFWMLVAWSKPQPIAPLAAMPQVPQSNFWERPSPWADSVVRSLTNRQRLAQLIMLQVYSNKDEAYYKKVSTWVSTHGAGGLIFFQGGPVRQVALVNRFQQAAAVPLLVAMDAEWGPQMRFEDSAMTFPRQMQLGAIGPDSLLFQFGQVIAEQLKVLGVNVNFAPVVDVNNNPANPVINYRSFGELPWNVARKGLALAQGMQSEGVMAVAKHFPGHGDTNSDSHKTLPTVPHSRPRLDSVELVPFRHLITHGVAGVMNAHLHVPALDSAHNRATSLSPMAVSQVLQRELGFRGLAFTDALGMKGVSAYQSPEQVLVRAFRAGNDILLMPSEFPQALDQLEAALKTGQISEGEVLRRAHKVLKAKEWLRLHRWQALRTDSIYLRLNSPRALALRRNLVEASVVVAANRDSLLPLRQLDSTRIATLAVGNGNETEFQRQLGKYAKVAHFQINKYAEAAAFAQLQKRLATFDVVVVGFHQTRASAKENWGITQRAVNFVQELGKTKRVVVAVFASPYSLRNFDATKIDALLLAHNDQQDEQQAAAQIVFGGLAAGGQLPVSAGKWRAGRGFVQPRTRLSYVPTGLMPLLRPERLASIDTLIQRGIRNGVFPGCQLVVAHRGRVFVDRSYGHHTYSQRQAVERHHLYDLASLTKVAATLPVVLQMREAGLLDLAQSIAQYLGREVPADKADITVRDLLLHQSGLAAGLPFFRDTYDWRTKQFLPRYYASVRGGEYPLAVAPGIFALRSYPDTVRRRILQSPLDAAGEYRYSDLGFILLKDISERASGLSFEKWAHERLFSPLGTGLCFNPAQKSIASQYIVPSEHDHRLRKQLLHGYVNDLTAAQLGGVAGHAGLFGSANDLAIFLQMLLQGGSYGGQRYLQNQSVREATRCYHCTRNRRALGFDRPNADASNCSVYASPNSFGHTGYTGGFVWADPDNELLFVFLTNRTFPTSDNDKIIEQNTRTQLLSLVYQALGTASTL